MYYDTSFADIIINFDNSNNNLASLLLDNSNNRNLYSSIIDNSNNNLISRLFDISSNNLFSQLYDNSYVYSENSPIRYLYIPMNNRENFFYDNNRNNFLNISNELNSVSNNIRRNNIYFNRLSQSRIYNEFNDQNNLNRSYRNLIEESFQEKNKYKKIATEFVINSLEKIIFKTNNQSFKNTSCPIYYIDFEDNEEITILPCKHCFNNFAIKKWLSEESNECPVCRYELSYNEVKIDNKNLNQNSSNINENTETNNTLDEPILESNNEVILENNHQQNLYNSLQQMINRIYANNYNSNIRNNLSDYVIESDNNNLEEQEDDDMNDINLPSNNIYAANRINATNTYITRLRSNFYTQLQSAYNDELYNRDLEEAISRSLEEQ